MSDSQRFADVFAEALDAHGVGLTWLRERLKQRGHSVSLAALSYWRSGQREPGRRDSLDAIDAIEEILGLDPSTLSSHLRGRAHSGPTPFDELVGLARRVGQDRGLVGEDEVDRIAFDLVVDVDHEGRVTQVRVSQIFVAAVEGAASVTMFVAPGVSADGGAFGDPDVGDTHLRAVSGCTVDGIVHVVDGVSAATLRFDRPLVLGESVATEIVMVPLTDEAALDAQWGAVAEQRLEHCAVWVRFHPDRLPRRSWVGFQEAGIEHEWPVALDGGTGLLHRQTDFGPGLCTARWEW